jgi:hypothetical protein
VSFIQCDSYLHLIKESLAAEATDPDASLDTLLTTGDDDKTYAAMGVAKTIGTVSHLAPF